jgi:oxidase EvaA
MENWYFESDTGNLVHSSRKFFSIEGLSAKTNWGAIGEWDQPIINQPEVGILGIVVKKFDGILHFLMQAKIEPGNVNIVQLSPTVQATESNFTQVHKGKKTKYLEYFLDRSKGKILIDQLQSEQGARFLKKRNRNVIVEVDEDIPLHDNFCWLTLGQIKKMMRFDNVVNMDTRTVIASIPFGTYNFDILALHEVIGCFLHSRTGFQSDLFASFLDNKRFLFSIDEIFSWLTRLKAKYKIEAKKIPLRDLRKWRKDSRQIFHESGNFFSVRALSVNIDGREVRRWMQPILKPSGKGICAFLAKKINGVYHFLVQAKVEVGNLDVLELAPTVQCVTNSYDRYLSDTKPPFLDYVLSVNPKNIRFSSIQSEEGGRFYHEQNRNIIIEVDDDFPLDVHKNYIWMTLNQIAEFIKFNNYLNIQARSLIACLSFI